MSTDVLFCFVLFCFVLFCFVLFCFVLFWFDLIWFDLIWFDLIWFDLIWFDLVCFVLFCVKQCMCSETIRHKAERIISTFWNMSWYLWNLFTITELSPLSPTPVFIKHCLNILAVVRGCLMVTKEKSLWVYIGHAILIALQKTQINLTVCVCFCYSCDTLFTLTAGGH